ncbi:MAG: hypothetical protein H0X64_09105, partial [Gemmatimonadaceae bacterium]|nr:hypothetical protein [Gemmatimonadaceae bacterium]
AAPRGAPPPGRDLRAAPLEREMTPSAMGRAGALRAPADVHAPFEGPPLDDAPHPADMEDDRRAPPARAAGAPDVNGVAAAWDRVVATVRSAGKTMLATALEHASPAAVTAQGLVTVELDDPNEFYAQSLDSGRADLLVALQAEIPSVTRVELKGGKAASTASMKRISDDDIRSARLAKLRKHDPVLDAAIDALDLDVVD